MTKRPAKRARTPAQIEAEARREKTDALGKVLVRHTKESATALAKLRKRFDDKSDPEIMRIALVELAAKPSNR